MSMAPDTESPRRAWGHVRFLLGIVASIGFYGVIHAKVSSDALLYRYLCGHWVEYVETWMFLWALLALAAKLWHQRRERAALHRRVLPPWSGKTVSVDEAPKLLAGLGQLARGLQNSPVVSRIRSALEFVTNRGSTDGLDDHLRNRADADADAVDGSYSLLRFITWAIPILGFLGTVLGITEAIANVTPEQLAKSITGVTDGLAIAFDTTAIALGYSMCIMFFSFVLDRGDQNLLAGVEAIADREIAHRFERLPEEGNVVLEVVQRGNDALLRATEGLVQRQSSLWAETMTDMQKRFAEMGLSLQERFTTGLKQALDQTLSLHQTRLLEMEAVMAKDTERVVRQFELMEQALQVVTQGLEEQALRTTEQAATLRPVLDSEQQILRLQETLQENLRTLAHSGEFQEALHSLTAAIHLLTARATATGPVLPMPRDRQGKAA